MRYLILLLLLAGCATTERQWFKAGATSDDFHAEAGQCRAQALSVTGMDMYQSALVYRSCMAGKGWRVVEK